jgi:hypothetical protein
MFTLNTFKKKDALSLAPLAETPSNLPRSYDDPESALYVPEELREYYLKAAVKKSSRANDVSQSVSSAAYQSAHHDLIAKLGEKPTNSSKLEAEWNEKYNKRIASLSNEYEEKRYYEMLELGIHTRIMRIATELKRADELQSLELDKARAKHTCPVCNQFDVANNGECAKRSLDILNRPIAKDSHAFVSCMSCYQIARTEYLKVIASDEVLSSDGTTLTRLEAVKAKLTEAE